MEPSSYPRRMLAAAFSPALLPGGVETAFACDTGSCPLLTQSQDSVRNKGSFGIDVAFRTMRHDRYVGRPGAASPLVDFENDRLVGEHHQDASMDHELLQIDLSYGLSRRLTLTGALPLLNRRSHGHYEYRPADSQVPFAWRFVGKDSFHGQSVPATGITTLSVVPGVRVSLTGRSVLYTYVKIPIATSSGGAPLAPTLDVAVGVGTRF